jgi:hypothetical protein
MKQTRHVIHSVLFILLLSLLIPCSQIYAQEPDDEVKSLGEILNPKVKDYTASLPSKERGNIYYNNCMATESLAFDKDEKEILCACTASKLGNILTGEEFVQLYKDTKEGTEARMKVITFAYTECMDFAINQKVYKDCRVLPLLQNIVRGKKDLCQCTAGHYERLINEGAAHLILEGVKYQPMTLNPLEHYFTTDGYYNSLKQYTKVCRGQLMYNKHN